MNGAAIKIKSKTIAASINPLSASNSSAVASPLTINILITIGSAIMTNIHTPVALVRELILSSARISKTNIATGIAKSITQRGFSARGLYSTEAIAIVINTRGTIIPILAREPQDLSNQLCSNRLI